MVAFNISYRRSRKKIHDKSKHLVTEKVDTVKQFRLCEPGNSRLRGIRRIKSRRRPSLSTEWELSTVLVNKEQTKPWELSDDR